MRLSWLVEVCIAAQGLIHKLSTAKELHLPEECQLASLALPTASLQRWLTGTWRSVSAGPWRLWPVPGCMRSAASSAASHRACTPALSALYVYEQKYMHAGRAVAAPKCSACRHQRSWQSSHAFQSRSCTCAGCIMLTTADIAQECELSGTTLIV